jgi:hypothetical protein
MAHTRKAASRSRCPAATKRWSGNATAESNPLDLDRRLIAMLGVALVVACRSGASAGPPTTAAVTPAPSASAPAPSMAPAMAATDSFSAIRERAVAGLLQRIAGKEKAPAESVFQNIKTLKGVPADQFLGIMNEAFGHGLGVSCGFCHVPGQWALDQKPNKDVAREMVAMVVRLNTDLRAMRNLPDTNPMVGCVTCHRGQQKPVLISPSR